MPRHQYDRQALRCAYQIQHTLRLTRQTLLHDQARWVVPVLQRLPQIARTAALLTHAVSRSSDNAAIQIIDQRLLAQLRSVVRDLQTLEDQLISNRCPPIPPLRALIAELNQLENEFAEWNCDVPVSELSVTTEPISLEGVDLGPFQIRLRMGQPITQLLGRLCWVEALEPNPAAGNCVVTHPHVSGEAVCVGEHGPELIRALRSGRVCDFFLMIRSILTTYNPGSPYASLDDWYGEPCSDCGRSLGDDGRYTCEPCGRSVCDDCISSCPHCDTTLCYGCVTMCRGCETSSCVECLEPCADCGDLVCPGCLDDDLCPTCLENRNEEEDDDDENHDSDETTHGEPTTPQQHHQATTPPGTAEPAIHR